MTDEQVQETVAETTKDEFFFIEWRQLHTGKMHDKQALVQGMVPAALIQNMKEMHRQKQLTTADYKYVNLSSLLAESGLEIRESE